jgi:large subunit ribosomal protein L29
MKAEELRRLTKQDLLGKLDSLLQELFTLNQQRYGGRVEKPHQFKILRKEISRIKTIINESRKEKNRKVEE